MNFEFVSIGGTIAIGFAAVVLAWTMAWILGWAKRCPILALRKERAGVVAVVTVVSIAVGICVDGVADWLADRRATAVFRRFWGDDNDIKVATLFELDEQAWRPRPLARQLVSLAVFSREATEGSHRLVALEVERAVASDRAIDRGPPDAKGDVTIRFGERTTGVSFERIVVPASHEAKARVLRLTSHTEELRDVQRRIDFGRSLCVLGFVSGLASTVLVLLLTVVRGLAVRAAQAPVTSWNAVSWSTVVLRAEAHTQSRSIAWMLLVTAAAFAMYLVGGTIFARQEDEFDKRIFGYYYSLLRAEAPAASNATLHAPDGLSGLAPLSDDSYLAVLDTKGETSAARFAIVTLRNDAVEYPPIPVDLGDVQPKPSDLESLVRVADRTYLACESSSYTDPVTHTIRPHRLFELTVSGDAPGWRATITRRVDLQWPTGAAPIIEAMAWLPPANATATGKAVLFDRGRDGVVACFTLPWPASSQSASPEPRGSLSFAASLHGRRGWRGCSDIALVGDRLVGLSTFDPDDAAFGPFETMSFTAPAAFLTDGGSVSVEARPLWVGLKGEAMCAMPDGRWLVGTDDEALGAVVRLVPASALGL